MRFRVTQGDIENARKAIRGERIEHPVTVLFVSPVALCLERTTRRPWLLGSYLATDRPLDEGYSYDVPPHVTDQMRRFDASGEMEPFDFELSHDA